MITTTNTPIAILDPSRLPVWQGWQLLGCYPSGQLGDVGSWILYNNGEALLLETPQGIDTKHLVKEILRLKCTLKVVTTSNARPDHCSRCGWAAVRKAFPKVQYMRPNGNACTGRAGYGLTDHLLMLGGEPCWIISAPKHSRTDQVVVFQGVAHVGAIELGTLDTLNSRMIPVSLPHRQQSMAWLQQFPQRASYTVHSVVSSRLNDLRQNVVWEDLFTV